MFEPIDEPNRERFIYETDANHPNVNDDVHLLNADDVDELQLRERMARLGEFLNNRAFD